MADKGHAFMLAVWLNRSLLPLNGAAYRWRAGYDWRLPIEPTKPAARFGAGL